MQNTVRSRPGSERVDSGIPRMHRSHLAAGDSSDRSGDNPIYTPWVTSADSKWGKIIETEKGCSSDNHVFISVSYF